MKAFSIVLALVLVSCARHQAPVQPSDAQPSASSPGRAASAPAPIATGRAAATEADTINEISVRSHLQFLASDALNGRGSGTRDEWLAAEYIASHLRGWGIEPLGDGGDYVQAIAIERTTFASAPTLSFDATHFTHGQEILVSSMGAPRVSGPLQKLAAGATAEAGTIALAAPDPPATTGGDRGSGGVPSVAAAMLSLETPQVRSRWNAIGARLPSFPARLAAVSAPGAARPASIVLSRAAYDAMAALPDGTIVTIQGDLKPTQKTHTYNATGRLTGSDPRAAAEVILLTAHLDHLGNRAASGTPEGADTIYNGADDDASGSVAVLELAEALARGPRPKRTILFIWFGSEESGGYGARFFLERPPVPLDRIVANLEFEMIGRPDAAVAPHTLWLTGYDRSTLGPELASQGARLVADPHPEQNFFQRSDNIQLARRGVIAQTVSSYGLHPQYHSPQDDVQHIDFAHMTAAIKSMLEPVRWLANSGFRPTWLPGKRP